MAFGRTTAFGLITAFGYITVGCCIALQLRNGRVDRNDLVDHNGLVGRNNLVYHIDLDFLGYNGIVGFIGLGLSLKRIVVLRFEFRCNPEARDPTAYSKLIVVCDWSKTSLIF